MPTGLPSYVVMGRGEVDVVLSHSLKSFFSVIEFSDRYDGGFS